MKSVKFFNNPERKAKRGQPRTIVPSKKDCWKEILEESLHWSMVMYMYVTKWCPSPPKFYKINCLHCHLFGSQPCNISLLESPYMCNISSSEPQYVFMSHLWTFQSSNSFSIHNDHPFLRFLTPSIPSSFFSPLLVMFSFWTSFLFHPSPGLFFFPSQPGY